MIKIKTKEGNTGVKTKGTDTELLADMPFLMASIGKKSRSLLAKMPEEMHSELKATWIKVFVKTLNGEEIEKTIKEAILN